MGDYIDMRKDVQDAYVTEYGVKLTFMSALMKASVAALKEQPIINAVIDDTDIVYRDFIDINTAVSLPCGIVKPVLRNVQDFGGFADFERRLDELAYKAREGNLTQEDQADGTFMIRKLGDDFRYSKLGNSIKKKPQNSILCMYTSGVRPIVKGDKILSRHVMDVTLTYDQRIIDKREAVIFLRRIKECVEDPK